MYSRKADCELFYDCRESIGSSKSSLLENDFGYTKDRSSSSLDHYNPTLRLLRVPRSSNGSMGFYLTRSKWDPYPWISAVDANTPAKFYGLKAGECVLEVNGKDVLGMRISEIADLLNTDTRPINDDVALLLWSPGSDNNCSPTNLCCGPMPMNLERLTAFTQTILAIIECPVCLETIAPPILQCQNGHILCVKCRILSHSCPVCRQYFYPGRSLVAEQIYNSITDTFNLRSTDKSDGRVGRGHQLFGAKYKTSSSESMLTLSSSSSSSFSSLSTICERRQGHQGRRNQKQENNNIGSCLQPSPPEVNKFESLKLPTNKLLSKLLGRANSMENLSSACRRRSRRQSAPPLSLTWITIRRITDDNIGECQDTVVQYFEDENQANCNGNLNVFDEQLELEPTALNTPPGPTASISKQLSLSAGDLSKKDNDGLIAIQHECLSKNRLQYLCLQRNSLQLDPLPVLSLLSAVPSLSQPSSLTENSSAAKISSSYVEDQRQLSLESTKQISCCTQQLAFFCPFGCGKQFGGPALQQHIKVDHSAPILCYNSSSAELALPLRAPLDKAAVLLMCDGKDFWIKLRTHGDENITALAVFQGSQDESSDFLMETRLRNRTTKEQEVEYNTHQYDNLNEADDEEANDYVKIIVVNRDNGILERQLIMRSIVRSMNVATWEHTYFQADGGGEKEECEHFLYNQEDIRKTFGESIDFRNLLLEIIIIKKKCRNERITRL